MSGPKRRKVDSECRVFNKEWTTKYFFTEVRSTAVCLICQEAVAVFKEYNIRRHFATKHANYASKQSTQERAATAQRLAANLQSQQNFFHRQTAIQESSTKINMEKPFVLITSFGSPGGIYKSFAPFFTKHFTIVPYETFMSDQRNFAERVEAVFVWSGALKVDRVLMRSLPNLKVVVNGGVGVDHLDVPMINSFGVKVCNTPRVVDNATADIGMGLMLASARNIMAGHHYSLTHNNKDLLESSLGVDVSGATLGIIGMGRIGYKVARRAQGFDMKILYHNRSRKEEEEEKAVGATYCARMEDLLQKSDFVMLIVNLSPATHKLIGAKELAMMKPTSTLINISRGHVVDQDALVDALQRKLIRAAALDVTYPEPLPMGHPLASLPNVIVLPHMGTHSIETTQIMVEKMVTNALAALGGTQPPDEVTV